MSEPRTKHVREDREKEYSDWDIQERPEPVEEDSQKEEKEKEERTKIQQGHTWD